MFKNKEVEAEKNYSNEENEEHICIKNQNICLEFAKKTDRALIYKMLIAPDIYHFMFDNQYPAPSFEEFSQEEAYFYCGESNKNGNYLILKYQDIVVGSISYSLCDGKNKSYEIDIWIAKKECLGKGIGTDSIKMLIEYIGNTFGVHTYIIRPWKKNINAINAYKKCGFVEFDKIELIHYYSKENYIEYGEGDYGEDTVNLILKQ